MQRCLRATACTELDDVCLTTGERITTDAFVFALGPWLPKIFPDVVGSRIRSTRQEIFFFGPPAGDHRFLPDAMPCWADFNHGDMFYGFPDLENRGVKFAHDLHGPEVDPDTQDRRPTRPHSRGHSLSQSPIPTAQGGAADGSAGLPVREQLERRFPDRLPPAAGNVLLVGGGSGHGFKHGPEVGRYAAARLFGSVEPEPRFSLASKAETHHREVH